MYWSRILCLLAIVTSVTVSFAQAVPNSLVWDSVSKTAQLKPKEELLHFTFWTTNTSPQTIIIDRAETSCGCTTVKLPAQPWTLAPGTSGAIEVELNAKGKFGTLRKNILIFTSVGPRVLNVIAKLPEQSEIRNANQTIATKDRQTVFQGSCANCHATSAFNKHGKDLFVSACGICHTAEHRATMVPDLKALKADKTPVYWENWIRNGKPNSLMPAFEKKQNGILTDEQIKSLVQYLTEAPEFR